MKPSVRHIEGRHLTAADKRSILDCIAYQRKNPDAGAWLRRKGSPKRFCITPDPVTSNRYAVQIETSYRTDYGRPDTSLSRHVVEVWGIAPLPHPEQPNLI